jgi:hypothetical protein
MNLVSTIRLLELFERSMQGSLTNLGQAFQWVSQTQTTRDHEESASVRLH